MKKRIFGLVLIFAAGIVFGQQRYNLDGLIYEIVGGKTVSIIWYNRNAKTLEIPAQIRNLPVTAFKEGAFDLSSDLADEYNSGLDFTSITIPSSVTSIGDNVFLGYSSLTNIIVDNNNPAYASIDGVLFDKNKQTLIKYPEGKKEKTYTIPSSVTNISPQAFRSESLTSIVIPSSVTSLSDYAFSGCINLTSITIPSSVITIGEGAFYSCSSLTSINIDNNNPSYASIDGVLFDKNKEIIISYPAGKTARAYTIPSSVTSIGNSAFSRCGNLADITIPSSVTTISDYAFSMCERLTNITIPSSVISIGKSAFFSCKFLMNVTIPSSVQTIGDGAFSFCFALASVSISRRTKVGQDVFLGTMAQINYRD